MSGILSALGKKALKTVLSLVVVAALAGGYLAYKYFTGDTDLAKAGDCLVGESADDLNTVDCTDGKAKWKVAGRVDGTATSATVEESCKAHPTTQMAMYTTGGRRNYVLCLEEIKR